MNANNYKRPRVSWEKRRERQKEYWRRWKERQAPKKLTKFGWEAVFERGAEGWTWKARKIKNGAVLKNGPFGSMGKAKQDFYKAVE